MNLVELLRRDHREFSEALSELEQLTSALESRFFPEDSPGLHAALDASVILGRLLPKLEKHEKLERRYLFPELARWSSEFEPILKRIEEEHQQVDRDMGRLLDLLPDIARRPGSEFLRELERLAQRLKKHIFVEEIEIYPMAEDSIPQERLEQLAARAQAERVGADDPLQADRN